jgi:hypothetical protein
VHRRPSAAGMHIGFVSTRLAGTDGVSLETQKWASVLERMGCHCFYFAGLADTPAERSRVVPEAFFDHPLVRPLQQIAFFRTVRPPAVTRRIRELTGYLKQQIAAFIREFAIDVLKVSSMRLSWSAGCAVARGWSFRIPAAMRATTIAGVCRPMRPCCMCRSRLSPIESTTSRGKTLQASRCMRLVMSTNIPIS